jgi:hypothetical protein
MTAPKLTEAQSMRRAFVRSENNALGRFLEVDHLVGWQRSYSCECGFRCNAPGEIYDHTISGCATEAGRKAVSDGK